MSTTYVSETALKYPSLFNGHQSDIVTDSVTIKAAEGALPAGALLERTADGYVWAATNASTDVRAVLLEAVDATSAAATGLVAFTGEFSLKRMVCKDGNVPAQACIDAAQDRHIFFRKLGRKED